MPKKNGKTKDEETINRQDGLLISKINDELVKKIESIYDQMTPTNEFELMFYNYKKVMMSYEKYLSVMEFLRQRHKLTGTYKLEQLESLDIIYHKKDSLASYRISINGIENINKYMKQVHERNNHIIYNLLIMKIQSGEDKSITLIKKTRNKDHICDIDDFDMRVRMTEEVTPTKKEIESISKLTNSDIKDINFRYKQRVTLYVATDKDYGIKIDTTVVKTSATINKVEFMVPQYELEIELGIKNKPERIFLKKLLNEAEIILKVLQQSNYIISKTEEENVLNEYSKILSLKPDNMTALNARQTFSLEIQHVTEFLPNKYAASDKADGERFFLIIINNHVFLIDKVLTVKDTGISISSEKSKYNGTILDGEYIFLPKHNRHLFMTFDCLFKGEIDVRKEPEFMKRLAHADEIIQNCFVLDSQKGFQIQEYDGKFDMHSILRFHRQQIHDFMDALVNDIEIDKKYPLIRRKYFIACQGGNNGEIFKYTELLWELYVFDKKVRCPYHLDGIVYHPLRQSYVTGETQYKEYKWKPPEKNSIDFYIQFKKNDETGKQLIVYDNSRDEFLKNKPYKICYLHVGQISRKEEYPVLFQQETRKYLSYLFLKGGEVRDIQGNIIQDRTVVEFYYNNDIGVPEEFRWVPIKTRYDKTESVMRYKRKYGNYSNIADRIWRSIVNPVLMKDISILADDKMYSQHMEILRGRISHELRITATNENKYYKFKTNLAKPMRNFHNWIKSTITYTYFNPTYFNNKQMSVLDIAVGRGGDLMRYYYISADYVVGTDLDNENLVSAVDGAQSRYDQARKTHPKFPKMFFFQANACVPYNYDDQIKSLGNMSDESKILMNKFFSSDPNKRTMFDRVSCQFAMHYFLANDTTWNNFCENIKNYLKPGGYFIATCFDAKRVMEALDGKNNYEIYYTERGEKKMFHNIVKKYTDPKSNAIIGTGYAIDVYNSTISREDEYMTEYLVDKRFVEAEFLKKCDLELVDTDLFENQFVMHKEYFTKYYKYESNNETLHFLNAAASFYDQENDVNKASYKIMRLNRYYVFKRKENISNEIPATKQEKIKIRTTKKSEKESSKQTGGESPLSLENLIKSDKFMVKTTHNFKDFTYQEAIYDILKSSNIIPKSVTFPTFYHDTEIDLIKDSELTDNDMLKINKKIIIEHETDDTSKIILNGLNVFILKKDCDDVLIGQLVGDTPKKINKNFPSIVLLFDGKQFSPLYRKDDMGNFFSMFKVNDGFIEMIINQLD